MFKCVIGGISCKISLLFPAILLSLFIADKSGAAAIGFLAALLHECGHGVAMCCYGEKPKSLAFSFYGMKMELPPETKLTYYKQMVVALAGPFVNIIAALLLLWSRRDTTALALHLALATINLLPVWPSDGGQVLFWGLSLVCSAERALNITKTIGALVVVPMIVFGGMLYSYAGNLSLLFVSLYLGISMLFYKGN